MLKESDTSLSNMGKLNNSIIGLIDSSECSTIEVITVLRTITLRLDKAFELSVMGNPVSSIAETVKNKNDGNNPGG